VVDFVIKFYKVSKCGYYEWGGNPAFGNIKETLEQLKSWSARKQLIDTKVSSISNVLPTYLFDIKSYGGSWIVTLWNQVPADDGQVSSVMPTDTVGNANVLSNPLVPDSIPGFPTYFYWEPDQGLMATLRTGDQTLGLNELKNYLKTFLGRSSDRVVVEAGNGSVPEVAGYLNDQDEIDSNVRPGFEIQLVRKGSQAAKIIANYDSITKVIRVEEINIRLASERSKFQRMLDWMDMTAAPRAQDVRIKFELPVTMSKNEVKEFISSVENDVEPLKNDVGFLMKGSQNPLWLSNSIPSVSTKLSVEKVNGAYSADQLSRLMHARKDLMIAESGL